MLFRKTCMYPFVFCCFLVILYISMTIWKYELETRSIEATEIKFSHEEKLCYHPQGYSYSENRLEPLKIHFGRNETGYVSSDAARNQQLLPKNFRTLAQFIVSTRDALLSRRFKYTMTTIRTIFRDPPFYDVIKPSCDGLWMEFGVWGGNTLNHAAKWKSVYCGNQSDPVYGFDTFSGLPTDWRRGFPRGSFQLKDGKMPKTLPNTVLIKGLFIDTLPVHLRKMDQQFQCRTPVSFVHIDCDIYDGARDILFLLSRRLVPGSIIVFDELYNYPSYEKHELKALYEFVSGTSIDLVPLGSATHINLNVTSDIVLQSFGFVVV